MPPPLRLEQQREARIAGDLDAADVIHLDRDGEGHASASLGSRVIGPEMRQMATVHARPVNETGRGGLFAATLRPRPLQIPSSFSM